MADDEPQRHSKVMITFTDGEVKEYVISAGRGIMMYLTREAGQTGILTLWNKQVSYAIPIASIRDWSIEELPVEVTTFVADGEMNAAISGKRRRKRKEKADDIPC